LGRMGRGRQKKKKARPKLIQIQAERHHVPLQMLRAHITSLEEKYPSLCNKFQRRFARALNKGTEKGDLKLIQPLSPIIDAPTREFIQQKEGLSRQESRLASSLTALVRAKAANLKDKVINVLPKLSRLVPAGFPAERPRNDGEREKRRLQERDKRVRTIKERFPLIPKSVRLIRSVESEKMPQVASLQEKLFEQNAAFEDLYTKLRQEQAQAEKKTLTGQKRKRNSSLSQRDEESESQNLRKKRKVVGLRAEKE